jgi:hypothetical protein
MERLNLKKLKKLSEMEGKDQYQVKISNRFTGLENLDDNLDINRAWETLRQRIKISSEESRLL